MRKYSIAFVRSSDPTTALSSASRSLSTVYHSSTEELESSEGKEARDAHAEACTSRFVLAAAAAAAWDPGVVRAFPPPLLLLLASWAL